MSDVNFVEVNADLIISEAIKRFEDATGEILYPGDERRIFLLNVIPIVVGLKNDINISASQNLLKYATGSMLDLLGDLKNTPRIPAQKAVVTLRFTLSGVQGSQVVVPKGTRATPDGILYFETSQALTIAAGQTTGDVVATATEAGSKYNGLTSGQVKNLVDQVAYVASVSNTNTSSGGADIEADDDGTNTWSGYRERIREAPEGYSTAGPEGAYIYWAKTADASIVDVAVSSPSAGTVRVVPLLKDGAIPAQSVLDKVLAAVSASNRRPLTDNVQVAAPTHVAYNITFTYYISTANKADETIIKNAVEGTGGAVDQFKSWQCAVMKRAINPDELRKLVMNAGACRITLTAPSYATLTAEQVATVGTVTITYGGLE